MGGSRNAPTVCFWPTCSSQVSVETFLVTDGTLAKRGGVAVDLDHGEMQSATLGIAIEVL
jgi:hypothetical protein